MITRLRSVKQFLAPPVFADEEKTRIARTLNAVLVLVVIAVGLYFIVSVLFTIDTPSIILAAIMTLVPIGLRILMRRGHVRQASSLLSIALMINVTLAVYSSGGIRAPITSAYLVGIAIAGLLVSTQAAVGMVALVAAALVVLAQAEINGQLTAYSPLGPLQIATYLGAFSIIAVLLSFSTRNAQEALDRAHHRERDLDASNRALQALRASLEQRVAERTVQLQISAEVGRAAAAILDQDQLLHEVVTLITERFGFYYAAAFLLDESGKSAVLREATGQAGQALKERGHSLEVGGQSMVGYVTAHRKRRIALDVGADAVRFANPLLPNTRSEIALPLILGDRVLGALDVQSTQAAVFDETYATVLQSMADQIAVALNNAQHFKQTEQQVAVQANLNQLSRGLFSATSTETLYRILAEQIGNVAPYDYLSLTLIQSGSLLHEYELRADTSPVLVNGPTRAIDNSLSGRACNTHQITLSMDTTRDAPSLEDMADLARSGLHSAASLPLLLGDRVLGTLNLARRLPAAFLAGELALFNQIAGPIAAALENARLAEAQQRTLQELEVLTHQLTKQAWSKQIQQMPGQVKYTQYARSGIKSISPGPLPELETAMQTAEPIAWTRSDDQPNPSPYQATLATPIMLRGEVLGGLQVSEANRPRAWSKEDITFIQAVADQVALALDNARLIDQTERRAQAERVISEIGNKLLSASDLSGVVRIASEELGRVLHVARVETTIGGDHLRTEAEGLAAAAGNGHKSEG